MVESPVIEEAGERDAKDGIVRHENRKDLGIPNSLLFQVGTY